MKTRLAGLAINLLPKAILAHSNILLQASKSQIREQGAVLAAAVHKYSLILEAIMVDIIMCFMPLLYLISNTVLRALILTFLALVECIVRNHDGTELIRHFLEFLLYIL